jgi:hypothetical protein
MGNGQAHGFTFDLGLENVGLRTGNSNNDTKTLYLIAS